MKKEYKAEYALLWDIFNDMEDTSLDEKIEQEMFIASIEDRDQYTHIDED